MGSKTRHANPNFKNVNTSGNCIAVPCQHMRSPSSQAFLGEIAQVGYANHTVSICLLWNRYEPLCKGIVLQLLITTATMASLGFAWLRLASLGFAWLRLASLGFAWLLQLSYDWVPKPTMLVISSIDSETLLGSKHRPHVPTRSGRSMVHVLGDWRVFLGPLCVAHCLLNYELEAPSLQNEPSCCTSLSDFDFKGPW